MVDKSKLPPIFTQLNKKQLKKTVQNYKDNCDGLKQALTYAFKFEDKGGLPFKMTIRKIIESTDIPEFIREVESAASLHELLIDTKFKKLSSNPRLSLSDVVSQTAVFRPQKDTISVIRDIINKYMKKYEKQCREYMIYEAYYDKLKDNKTSKK